MNQDAIQSIQNTESENVINQAESKELTLEQASNLLLLKTLKSLGDQSDEKLRALNEDHQSIQTFHRCIQGINAITDEQGECDITEDLQELLTQAKELGIPIDTEKMHYSHEERHRLIENIRMTLDDYTSKYSLNTRELSHFMDKRHEAYQLARTIAKTLHDAKIQIERAIAGR